MGMGSRRHVQRGGEGLSELSEVILLEDVWFQYDGVPVLEGINLSVREQDFMGIIGPNGGGKTTLLNIMLGLMEPTSGRVSILGRAPRAARRFVGYVPQYTEFDHAFPISVWDVTMMGRLGRRGLLRRYSEEDKRIVEEALQQVDMLEYRDRKMGQLSEGSGNVSTWPGR